MKGTIIALATSALLAAGCSTLSGDQGQLVQSDIQRLDRQVRELQKGQASADVARRLEQLEKGLQQLTQQLQQVQRTQADLTARYDAIRQDQMTLTGRFEEAKHLAQRVEQGQDQVQRAGAQLAAMDQRLRQLDQELDALRRQVEQTRGAAAQPGGGAVARATPPGPGAPAPSAARPAPVPQVAPGSTAQAAEALYQEGFELFKKREFAKAREKFQAFLRANASSDFAEGAMYFVAETYFAERDYENAILRYEELLVRFPKGRRVPAALLQQGFAFKELGAPRDARLSFQKVVDGYPNSTEATLARVELPKLPAQ